MFTKLFKSIDKVLDKCYGSIKGIILIKKCKVRIWKSEDGKQAMVMFNKNGMEQPIIIEPVVYDILAYWEKE